jgi:hypothetical protein
VTLDFGTCACLVETGRAGVRERAAQLGEERNLAGDSLKCLEEEGCSELVVGGGGMRGRTVGVLMLSIARSLAVFVASVVGAAAIGALVGGLIWGQWLVGAGLAACLAALLALPTGWSGVGGSHPGGYSPLLFHDRGDGGGAGGDGSGGGL